MKSATFVWSRTSAVLAKLAQGLTVLVLLQACSFTGAYNKSYVPSEAIAVPKKLDGKVLIYTEAADDDYKFKGNPASFTGNATTLELPLGVMTREIAGIVFANLFEGGADKGNSLSNADQYSLALTPKVTTFEYAYNQLKNAGFAITPQSQVKLNVKLLDGAKEVFYENSYESGVVDGDTYMLSGEPGERISKLTHKILFEQMKRAAQDVYREQRLHSIGLLKAKSLISADEYEARKKVILEAK